MMRSHLSSVVAKPSWKSSLYATRPRLRNVTTARPFFTTPATRWSTARAAAHGDLHDRCLPSLSGIRPSVWWGNAGNGTTGTLFSSRCQSTVALDTTDLTRRDHQSTASTTTSTTNVATAAGPFPSLLLGADNIVARGSFAQAQKIFLQPDTESVAQLSHLLHTTRTGIVAHYYMDVELQGILSAVMSNHAQNSSSSSDAVVVPIVGIADSLKMGDLAVQMATSHQVDQIICLGVDFMAESVAAILNQNGYAHIPVYRADARKIGCSLAESAENLTYRAWLEQASSSTSTTAAAATSHDNSSYLHVVYINTSLETKAVSNAVVPTITCTSSNVLSTILTAAAQIPNVQILYGPDTYMGQNLVTLLTALWDTWTDDDIATRLHPAHSRASLRQLRNALHVFPSGHCVVHHMFGAHVVDTVLQHYADAYVTAHLEVPGEMFEIALHASLSDRGVVGSTSDILHFIARKVREAAVDTSGTTTTTTNDALSTQPRTLQFILGTEAGMVTSIVASVQSILQETGNTNVQAEIVFPVSSDAVMVTSADHENDNPQLPLVPGVAGGEGCSTAGGCATCPYMKMNSIDAVYRVLELVQEQQRSGGGTNENALGTSRLQKHLSPERLNGQTIQGRPALDWGTEPIKYMREFNRTKQLPDDLVQRVLRTRTSAS
jgi:quinolinate synthase